MTDWDHDPFIDSVAKELRRPVRLDAGFDDRVMEALDAPTVLPLRRPIVRPWRERRWTVSVTPLGGLAAAAAVGAIVFSTLFLTREAPPTQVVEERTVSALPIVPVANTPVDLENMVVQRQFTLLAPTARKLAIIGDFNDWDASRGVMQRLTPDGLWSVTLPLRVGRHEYQFVVDDTLHIPDPATPQANSDFGSWNSVITVGPRQ